MGLTLTLIIGCTGSGKGALGRELARRIGAEIISLDSMKVYRRMDIGTAKPSREVRGAIPHHLIDVVEPWQEFSVAQFDTLAQEAIADIHRRGRPILVVGGTPMYLKALTEGLFEGPGADPDIRRRLHEQAETMGLDGLYRRLERVDPQAAARIHPNDLRRIVRALEVHELTGSTITALQTQWDRGGARFDARLIGLRRERSDQAHRINERVRRMIEAGWVDEVRRLLAEGRPMSLTARKALGYGEIIEHLEGRGSLADAVELIKIRTRRFAKAQRTWFRRFRAAQWIDVGPESTIEQVGDAAQSMLSSGGGTWSA